jgi:hypothetical protein
VRRLLRWCAGLAGLGVILAAAAFTAWAETGQPFTPARPPAATGPLRISAANPRYFTDAAGRIVYLTGAHTWSNFQDNGVSDPPPRFDYAAYLDSLVGWNHNFFRLWTWEQAKWTAEIAGDYWLDPLPWQRTGPGLARDGKPRFDLTRFNDAYFTRLRERVAAAGQRGIYVSIMLFDGWSVSTEGNGLGNPWHGHPFERDNNVNAIDGDPDHRDDGTTTHTLRLAAVTALQEAYVRRVIDAVNDLDNVLYEISNESHAGSTAWQYHMIEFIHRYERSKPKQHPVGMTAEMNPNGNPALFASPADWIAPHAEGAFHDGPAAGDGRKVILYDTDHVCGTCANTDWIWMAFVDGLNPILMDAYDNRAVGLGARPGERERDPFSRAFRIARRNLGYTLTLATTWPLAAMTPRPDLASTGLCLTGAAHYVVFIRHGGKVTVDLRQTPESLTVTWLNPALGRAWEDGVIAGGTPRTLRAPLAWRLKEVVLLLAPAPTPRG